MVKLKTKDSNGIGNVASLPDKLVVVVDRNITNPLLKLATGNR